MPIDEIESWVDRDVQIINVELYAILQAVEFRSDQIAGRPVMFFVDNQSAFYCLCKAGACHKDTRKLVRRIWKRLNEIKARPWWEWVESDANAADAPSRSFGDDDAWKIVDKVAPGYSRVYLPS